jgi:hypothetical protein
MQSFFKTLNGPQQLKNNYKPYLQLFSLCGNMCSCNLVIITIDAIAIIGL